MSAPRVPGFSADASLCRNSARYRAGALSGGVRQGGQEMIHPSMKAGPRWGCGYRECCLFYIDENGRIAFELCFEREYA
jgi:hypothetical protein